MNIVRYTPTVAKMLNSRVKSEPWLHAVIDCSPEVYGQTGKQRWLINYAIYVWDTRQVIDDDTIEVQATAKQIDKLRMLPSPPDSFEPLTGNFNDKLAVRTFNESFERRRQKSDN